MTHEFNDENEENHLDENSNEIDSDAVEKIEQTEKKETAGFAKYWSQVSFNKNKTWIPNKFTLIVGGLVLLIIVVMVFSGGKKQTNEQKNAQVGSTQSADDELVQNLAKIKEQMQNENNTLSTLNKNSSLTSVDNSNDPDQSMTTEKDSKEYLARQNAPTSMFNGGGQNVVQVASPVNNQNNSNNQNTNNTFAGQGTDTSFGNQAMTTTSVTAKKIAHPQFTIVSGEFLHATLETAINSDLPGEIRAVVSEPVYAYVGETPLIPAGSRLIGQYSASVTQGQDRVFVVWNRVILPNGTSAQINSPGVDQLGEAGQGADDVNTHFFARFGEASLLSIIGAGAATGGVGTGDQYNSAAQYRTAMAQSFQQSATNSLQGTLPIKPTLSIDQGAAINVFVAHDIDFYNVMNVLRSMKAN